MKSIIHFDLFSFKYRAQIDKTLHEIDLKINKGEKVLIIGPSGSGKSTLGQCLNSLIPNSFSGDISGSLVVDSKVPAEAGIFGMSKSVGTVLQDPDGQFIALSVGEDIAFALENDCVEQNEMKKIVKDTAKMVDMEEFLEYSPYNLSGGQKQRVALAGVMCDNVEILLFDEPLANLDPATGKYAIELIDNIHRETEATIIIIEHRLEDVLHRPVDRIVLIDEGRIIADTNTNEILSSNLLKKTGIREPLYITAIKYAGCDITEDIRPESLDLIDITTIKQDIVNWNKSISVEADIVSPNKLLEFKNVSFKYSQNQKKNVLDDISFSIYEGEMISIVGRNGAGKSTISKLICGFERENSGEILYAGKSLSNYSIKERADIIGLVMQNPNQMISNSMIYDEVAMGLVVRGLDSEEISRKVDKILKICGLYEFKSWPISALSFGQKKRVTIASILVLDPKIIILDEPTAGQDFRHYTEIMEFLSKINRENNITIIMITHDMHLMLEYTRRAIAISSGKIIADTTSDVVLTDRDIVDKANLKITSLYELALKCSIEDPFKFVSNFIQYDREVRK